MKTMAALIVLSLIAGAATIFAQETNVNVDGLLAPGVPSILTADPSRYDLLLSTCRYPRSNARTTNWHEVVFAMEDALLAEDLFREETWDRKMSRLDVVFRYGSMRETKIIFAEAEFIDAAACEPIILTERDERWIALPVGSKSGKKENLSGYHWVYVGQDVKNGLTYALLEYGYGDPGPIALLVSADTGVTWELRSVLSKITYVARFRSFAMDENGNGRLTVAVSDWDMTFGVKGGLYHYFTSDDGRSWTVPKYEPDNLAPFPKNQDCSKQSLKSLQDLLALKW